MLEGIYLKIKIFYRRITGHCINCGKRIIQSSPDNENICLECYMNIMIYGETEKGIV